MKALPNMTRPILSPELVKSAHSLIREKITRTPVRTSARLSDLASALRLTSRDGTHDKTPLISLYFKCENYQETGSFKYRGVMHTLARLSPRELRSGLVTTSSGR